MNLASLRSSGPNGRIPSRERAMSEEERRGSASRGDEEGKQLLKSEPYVELFGPGNVCGKTHVVRDQSDSPHSAHHKMLITKTYHDIPSALDNGKPIRIFVIAPNVPGYPQAKFPGRSAFAEAMRLG